MIEKLKKAAFILSRGIKLKCEFVCNLGNGCSLNICEVYFENYFKVDSEKLRPVVTWIIVYVVLYTCMTVSLILLRTMLKNGQTHFKNLSRFRVLMLSIFV